MSDLMEPTSGMEQPKQDRSRSGSMGHVHFIEPQVNHHESEINFEKISNGVEVHLGFTKVRHLYGINFTIHNENIKAGFTANIERQLPVLDNLTVVCDDGKAHVACQFYAVNEHLCKSEFNLGGNDFKVIIQSQVLGPGKGTPLLLNGITLLKAPDETHSEVEG